MVGVPICISCLPATHIASRWGTATFGDLPRGLVPQPCLGLAVLGTRCHLPSWEYHSKLLGNPQQFLIKITVVLFFSCFISLYMFPLQY